MRLSFSYLDLTPRNGELPDNTGVVYLVDLSKLLTDLPATPLYVIKLRKEGVDELYVMASKMEGGFLPYLPKSRENKTRSGIRIDDVTLYHSETRDEITLKDLGFRKDCKAYVLNDVCFSGLGRKPYVSAFLHDVRSAIELHPFSIPSTSDTCVPSSQVDSIQVLENTTQPQIADHFASCQVDSAQVRCSQVVSQQVDSIQVDSQPVNTIQVESTQDTYSQVDSQPSDTDHEFSSQENSIPFCDDVNFQKRVTASGETFYFYRTTKHYIILVARVTRKSKFQVKVYYAFDEFKDSSLTTLTEALREEAKSRDIYRFIDGKLFLSHDALECYATSEGITFLENMQKSLMKYCKLFSVNLRRYVHCTS